MVPFGLERRSHFDSAWLHGTSPFTRCQASFCRLFTPVRARLVSNNGCHPRRRQQLVAALAAPSPGQPLQRPSSPHGAETAGVLETIQHAAIIPHAAPSAGAPPPGHAQRGTPGRRKGGESVAASGSGQSSRDTGSSGSEIVLKGDGGPVSVAAAPVASRGRPRKARADAIQKLAIEIPGPGPEPSLGRVDPDPDLGAGLTPVAGAEAQFRKRPQLLWPRSQVQAVAVGRGQGAEVGGQAAAGGGPATGGGTGSGEAAGPGGQPGSAGFSISRRVGDRLLRARSQVFRPLLQDEAPGHQLAWEQEQQGWRQQRRQQQPAALSQRRSDAARSDGPGMQQHRGQSYPQQRDDPAPATESPRVYQPPRSTRRSRLEPPAWQATSTSIDAATRKPRGSSSEASGYGNQDEDPDLDTAAAGAAPAGSRQDWSSGGSRGSYEPHQTAREATAGSDRVHGSWRPLFAQAWFQRRPDRYLGTSKADSAAQVIVAKFTSTSAQAMAAAARSMASDYDVVRSIWTPNALPHPDLPAAVSRAIAASTAAAAAAEAQPQIADGAAGVRRDRGGERRAAAPHGVREAPETAGCADEGPSVDPVLWPLMPHEYMMLSSAAERNRRQPRPDANESGSHDKQGGGGGAWAAYRSGCGSSSRSRSNVGPSSDPSVEDTEVMAAVDVVLEEVASAILERGLYPVRDMASRLWRVLMDNPPDQRSSGASASGWEALLRLRRAQTFSVPRDAYDRTEQRIVKLAPYMSACQLIAVLATLSSLCIYLRPAIGRALFARAVELLSFGMPSKNTSRDSAAVDPDDELLASYDARPSIVEATEGEARGDGSTQRRLAPNVAALLLLLIVTVLPQQLAVHEVRWVVWHHLTAIVPPLPLPPPGARGKETGSGDTGVARAQGRRQQRQQAVELTGQLEERPGVPLVAVAALLVCANRLQVYMPGSTVEERAMYSVTRIGLEEELDSGEGAVTAARAATAAGGGDRLTARQLRTLLVSLTEEGVMLGSDVLWRLSTCLVGACRGGELHPEEVVDVLKCFARQMYDMSRKELAGYLGSIFGTIKAYGPPAKSRSHRTEDVESPAPVGEHTYSLSYLADLSGRLEVALGTLRPPSWADPHKLAALRQELARFAASGGQNPEAVARAWSAFIRQSPNQRPPALEPASLDRFIDEARRELLAMYDPGSSTLEGLES